jgi:hypothetical protein
LGRRAVTIVVLVAAAVLVTYAFSQVLPEAVDWHVAFRPAALALLSGQNPYTVVTFFNPPWVLILLAPLAVLPEPVGRAGLFTVSLVAMLWCARRAGARRTGLIAFLLSHYVVGGLVNGNIDWIPLLGIGGPLPLAVFLLMAKPQIGATIALYRFAEEWRTRGLRVAIIAGLPIALVTLLSFWLYGLWLLKPSQLDDAVWNSSPWPYAIPLGVALLVVALRQRNLRAAMGAGPCLSPFLSYHSLSVVLLGLVTFDRIAVAMCVLSWLPTVVRLLYETHVIS